MDRWCGSTSGDLYIAAPHTAALEDFYERVYRWYATPWEILRQLPGLAGHLKPDVTIADLERQARAQTDTAAEEMQRANWERFAGIRQKRGA